MLDSCPLPHHIFPPAQDCHVLWWCYWHWSLVFLQVPGQLNSGYKESGFPCFPEYVPKPSSFLVKVRQIGHHNADHVGWKGSSSGARRAWASCSYIRWGPPSVTICETFEMLFPPVCPRRAPHLSPKVTPLWMQREQSVSDPSHLLLNDSEGKIVLSLYHSPKNKMHQCSDYETFILKAIRIT